MAVLDVALAHYRTQQNLARAVVEKVLAAFKSLNPDDLTGSWQSSIANQVMSAVVLGQFTSASMADSYVTQVLAELGLDATQDSPVDPRALTGVASDGRDLAGLLYRPIVTTKMRIGAGADLTEALLSGQMSMARIAETQIIDAGRVATGVSIASRRTVTGYRRMLTPPSCSRCAVLAGKWYRWNAGFLRHPGCDCVHIPAVEDVPDDAHTDPEAYFASLSAKQQDATFTRAGATAIRDGADLGQVVNARRGMYDASGRAFTTEGIKKRAGGVRLMPEQLYLEAGGNRDEALRLLSRFGYIL